MKINVVTTYTRLGRLQRRAVYSQRPSKFEIQKLRKAVDPMLGKRERMFAFVLYSPVLMDCF